MNALPIKLIDPNPYQPRVQMDPARLQELAENIKAQGLLQPPVARSVDGRYQLAFGHRRFAAWQKAKPGEPFPAEVKVLTDRQMFEYAVTENEHRESITPLERAAALKAYIDEFQVNQAEAGKLFGLASQGAVSNLLRLLKLPSNVHGFINRGEIAERDARQLLPLLKLPNSGPVISDVVVKALKVSEGERSEELAGNVREAIRKAGTLLKDDYSRGQAEWDWAWPGKPIQVDISALPKGSLTAATPSEIPACKSCEFMIELRGEHWCLRQACYAAKRGLWRLHEAESISKKLGIPVATAKEKTEVVFNGGYNAQPVAKAALKLPAKVKTELLRLEVTDRELYDYYLRETMGNSFVILTTVDMAKLKKLLPKAEKKAGQTDGPSERWKEDLKRKREAAQKALKLVTKATPYVAAAFDFEPGVMRTLARALANYSERGAVAKKDAADIREFIAKEVLLDQVPHNEYEPKSTPENAVKVITGLAAELKVKLPAGWDDLEPKKEKTDDDRFKPSFGGRKKRK